MTSPRNEQLERLSAESQDHVVRAQASNADSRRHVLASKRAIERSLELLRQTVYRGTASSES